MTRPPSGRTMSRMVRCPAAPAPPAHAALGGGPDAQAPPQALPTARGGPLLGFGPQAERGALHGDGAGARDVDEGVGAGGQGAAHVAPPGAHLQLSALKGAVR